MTIGFRPVAKVFKSALVSDTLTELERTGLLTGAWKAAAAVKSVARRESFI